MTMIDKLADSVRRICEADQIEKLKRILKDLVGHGTELASAMKHTTPAAKDVIDPAAWQKSIAPAIDEAADFYDAYARAGHQAMLALQMMTMIVSEDPPQNAEEAVRRANESVAARVHAITARLTSA
jgi:hypothetical protein